MEQEQGGWLNVKQAAAAVGVTPRTLYYWMDGRRQRDGKWTRPILPYEPVPYDRRRRRIRRDVLLDVASKMGATKAMDAVIH